MILSVPELFIHSFKSLNMIYGVGILLCSQSYSPSSILMIYLFSSSLVIGVSMLGFSEFGKKHISRYNDSLSKLVVYEKYFSIILLYSALLEFCYIDDFTPSFIIGSIILFFVCVFFKTHLLLIQLCNILKSLVCIGFSILGVIVLFFMDFKMPTLITKLSPSSMSTISFWISGIELIRFFTKKVSEVDQSKIGIITSFLVGFSYYFSCYSTNWLIQYDLLFFKKLMLLIYCFSFILWLNELAMVYDYQLDQLFREIGVFAPIGYNLPPEILPRFYQYQLIDIICFLIPSPTIRSFVSIFMSYMFICPTQPNLPLIISMVFFLPAIWSVYSIRSFMSSDLYSLILLECFFPVSYSIVLNIESYRRRSSFGESFWI